jgi:cytoskeletal protein RodZ
MNDDQLRQRLQQADEHLAGVRVSTPANGPTGLIEAIHRRRRRQIRHRATLGVLAVLVLTATVASLAWNGPLSSALPTSKRTDPTRELVSVDNRLPNTAKESSPAAAQSGENIARLTAQIAALEAEASRARRLAKLYQAAASRDSKRTMTASASTQSALPSDVVADLQIDRAAAIAVLSADAQANDFHRPAEAVASYRSVLEYFPSSNWASVAQERLAQMEHMN